MTKVTAGVGALLGLAFTIVVFTTSLGVVHEICLDPRASAATSSIVVETHWTYVLWPPGPLASLDPSGRCVRNSPLREALSASGIWKLPSGEQQVRRHIASQSGNSAIGFSPNSAPHDNARRDQAYATALNEIMLPFTRPAPKTNSWNAASRQFRGAALKLRTALGELHALVPSATFARSQSDLVSALSAQAKVAAQLQSAADAHNAVSIRKLERLNVSIENRVRVATNEMVVAYDNCASNHFTSC